MRSAAKGRKAAAAAQRRALLFTHRGFSGPAVLDLSHHAVMAAERRLESPGQCLYVSCMCRSGNSNGFHVFAPMRRRAAWETTPGIQKWGCYFPWICRRYQSQRARCLASSHEAASHHDLVGMPVSPATCCCSPWCALTRQHPGSAAALTAAWTGESAADWQARLEQGGGASIGQLLRRTGIPARCRCCACVIFDAPVQACCHD